MKIFKTLVSFFSFSIFKKEVENEKGKIGECFDFRDDSHFYSQILHFQCLAGCGKKSCSFGRKHCDKFYLNIKKYKQVKLKC